VGVYLTGEAAKRVIMLGYNRSERHKKQKHCGGISDKRGNRKSNIVGLYLIGKAREKVILWGYI